MTEHTAQILFAGLVDYAGLYPPAALSMADAVRNYAEYDAATSRWILGRFICPASALDHLSTEVERQVARSHGAAPWRVSATGSGDVAADVRAIAAFNARHETPATHMVGVHAVVDTIEVKATVLADIDSIDATVPREVTTYIEVPTADDPAPWLDAIQRVARRPKIRMGGVTLDAFPPGANVVRFLEASLARHLVAKATAGLHHPLRGTFRLTYDDHATMGRMYGFLNVFLTTALLASGGTAKAAERLLDESDPRTITMDDDQVTWRDGAHEHHFDRSLLRRVRTGALVSFGSCSFREPVDESRAIGVL